MNSSCKNLSQRHSDKKNIYTHKIIHFSNICISKREETTQTTINREKAEKKTWYTHTTEYYAAVKRNVEHLYIMISKKKLHKEAKLYMCNMTFT